MEKIIPDVLKKIDWSELRNQKTSLLSAIIKAEQTGNDEFVNDLNGILNLIDALQDYAVDEMGIPEIHVYDFELEEEREFDIKREVKDSNFDDNEVKD